MAPKQRDHNPAGLGRAIINRQIKDARKPHDSGLFTADIPSERLKSVTQERDLDEFLNTAQLAGRDFTAERRNLKIIQQVSDSSQNHYLLSAEDEQRVIKKHVQNKAKLRVPRRPAWTKSMTIIELDKQEKAAFLDWRRGLAILQEKEKLLLTPFERNVEVWRQLWRVLERSHLIVQIVDARNPLRFRCEDLEHYVRDIEGTEGEAGTGSGNRHSLLLINKADLLTTKQRLLWANYFDSLGIRYAFYSAASVVATQQARSGITRTESALLGGSHGVENKAESQEIAGDSSSPAVRSTHPESPPSSDDSSISSISSSEHDDAYLSAEEYLQEDEDLKTKILSVRELENFFLKAAPDLSDFADSSGKPPSKLVVGLVGYPNVGKSSTINSLLGEKRVSVSSTPGKTKHFQTINYSDDIVLCDCPGLVFPQFATTAAELVCDGILPIDQLREYMGPISLVVRRIPQAVLEATYGLELPWRGAEEGGDGQVTPEDLLIAYAVARGYMRSGQGNPDEARASRYILKDYVNGKILFCHPPPGISENAFNERTHERSLLLVAGKKKAPVTRVGKDADTFIAPQTVKSFLDGNGLDISGKSTKSQAIDDNFFESTSVSSQAFVRGSISDGKIYTRPTMYPHQRIVADDGTPLPERHLDMLGTGKKHHKKPKRIKQRSGRGYD